MALQQRLPRHGEFSNNFQRIDPRSSTFQGFNDIPVNSLTHLFFSFGYITPGDFSIAGMDGLPYSLFSDFTNLKKKNPGLKTVVALGGWTFNDPGPTQKVFSDMVSTKENRARFIENLFSFMRQYAFDGVDFDWVRYSGPFLFDGMDLIQRYRNIQVLMTVAVSLMTGRTLLLSSRSWTMRTKSNP